MSYWNTTSDTDWMLRQVGAAVTDRKKRLLAAGFCRHIEQLITAPRCRDMIAQAELLSVFSLGTGEVPNATFLLGLLDSLENCADGEMPVDDLETTAELAEIVGTCTTEFYYACYDEGWGNFNDDLIGTCEAALAVSEASTSSMDLAAVATHAAQAFYRASGGSEQKVQSPEEMTAQCRIIRDVLPRAERDVKLDRMWLTATVVALAKGIYQERAFDRMPILADALQDAGCDCDEILNHCRGPGPHVRGCWVVDLVLGKE